MTKFRKWLIHKLGGFTELPKPRALPKLTVEEMRLVSVKSKIDLNDMKYMPEKFVENILKNKLMEQIQPIYHRGGASLDPLKSNIATAEIKVPSIYVKKEE